VLIRNSEKLFWYNIPFVVLENTNNDAITALNNCVKSAVGQVNISNG